MMNETRRGGPIRTAGLARWLLSQRLMVRAPILLFRGHLGFLFGSRLLLLEHRGRVSGRPRWVVLEVIDHPTAKRFVVASGFGRRAQWLLNVEHDPRVHVSIGARGRTAGTAHILPVREAADALQGYAARHPRSWGSLRPVLEATFGAPIDLHEPEIPLVALDLDHISRRTRRA